MDFVTLLGKIQKASTACASKIYLQSGRRGRQVNYDICDKLNIRNKYKVHTKLE